MTTFMDQLTKMLFYTRSFSSVGLFKIDMKKKKKKKKRGVRRVDRSCHT